MKIYIIRHGETDGNVRGIAQGWIDEPLNKNGIALARITAKALADVKFDVVISSPLSRAYDTAKIILDENHLNKPMIMQDERLKEISFGDWEGLGITKANFEIPSDNFNLFFTNPFAYENHANGESIYDICKRTGEFYQELINQERYFNKTILLVTHGVAMRALLHQVYDNKSDFWHSKVPGNCAVNIIEVNRGNSTLVGDDIIYYDPTMALNKYDLQ